MHELHVTEKNKTVLIPDHWDECSDKELESLFRMAMQVVDGKMTYGEYCVRAFCKLSGLRFGIAFQIRKRLNLHLKYTEALYRLALELAGWAFQKIEETDKYEFNYDSITNRYRAIKTKSSIMYGPGDLLSDITYKEFRSALDHMDDYATYLRANEPELADQSLHYFLSCLYRPGEKGKRCALDTEELDHYSLFVRKIPLWQKKWIQIWFAYCVQYIQRQPFQIEGAEVELELLFPQGTGDEEGTKKRG